MLSRSTSNRRTSHAERGSALLLSVVSVVVVSILAAGFLQLSLAVTRRLSSSADSAQAFNLAEAGLAEAYTGLAVARTGNIGSPAAPAVFGGGLLWVTAKHDPSGLVELECTAMYGTGRATLGVVCEPVPVSVSSLGIFTGDNLRLSSDARIDSFDSSQGTYADQFNTPLNTKAVVGSNSDVTLAANDFVNGTVQYGPSGKLTTAKGALISGATSARPQAETMPPVEVPDIALGKPVKHSGSAPMVVPPGEAGYQGLTIGKNAKLVLEGPLTLVVGALTLQPGAQMSFDTSDGPIEMVVTDSVSLAAGSLVATSSQAPADTVIQVAAPAGKTVDFSATSQFYGFIYAPGADVKTGASFEVFGGVVAKSLALGPQSKLHYDLSFAATIDSQLPKLYAWRVVDLPQGIAAKRTDPFVLEGLDPTTLPSPSAAHQDQQLDLRYIGTDSNPHSYSGPESTFDWSLVQSVLSGLRDGVAFVLQDPVALLAPPVLDPLVDLVNSSLTSKQLRDALLAASPVSEEALVAAAERVPKMSKSDLDNVLKANYPMSDTSLVAAIASAALDSSSLKGVLIDNSPLAPAVLAAALTRIPPLSGSDLVNLLANQ